MIGLVYYEIKKIFKQPYLLLILICLLAVGGIYHKSTYSNKSAYIKIAEDFDGLELSQLDYVLENYDFSQSPVDSDFYDQIAYLNEYENKIDNLSQELNENYSSDHIAKYFVDNYSHRSLERFIYPMGYNEFFNYGFSSLLLLILAVYIGSSTYSKEYELKVYPLLKTTVRNKYSVLSKSASLFITALIFVFIFTIFDFYLFQKKFSLSGFTLPLYSITSFSSGPLNVSIISFVLIRGFYMALGIWFFLLLFSLISLILKDSTKSLLVNSLIIIIINLLPAIRLDFLNHLSAFFISSSFQSLEYITVSNQILLLPYLTLVWTVFLVGLTIYLTHVIYGGKR